MNHDISYAPFLKRFAAYLIDIVISTILMLPLLIWYARGLFSDQSGLYLLGYSLYLMLGIFIIRFLYLTIGWTTAKGTLGCRITRITVITTRGKRLSFGRSALRYLALMVSTAVLGLGWVTMFATHRRQAVHDLLASTVVLTNTREKAPR